MNSVTLTALPGQSEYTMTREFNAPRALVFDAMFDPKHIPQWWGPGYLTTVVEQMEVKMGGVWRFTQKDPDGNEFKFFGVYHSVTAPERVINTFEWEGTPGHVILETLILTEVAEGKTLLTVSGAFQTVADRDAMLDSGMIEGANESYDRLEQILASLSHK
jgi:uncharacterized protein YndB with AHSA1/START domain